MPEPLSAERMGAGHLLRRPPAPPGYRFAARRLDHVRRLGSHHAAGRVIGAKPAAVCRWILDLLGAGPGDTLDDLFPELVRSAGPGQHSLAAEIRRVPPGPTRQPRPTPRDRQGTPGQFPDGIPFASPVESWPARASRRRRFRQPAYSAHDAITALTPHVIALSALLALRTYVRLCCLAGYSWAGREASHTCTNPV